MIGGGRCECAEIIGMTSKPVLERLERRLMGIASCLEAMETVERR